MAKITPFHIAIPVSNLEEARTFYGEVMGCPEGRSSDHWVDFDLYGHQLVIHYSPDHQGFIVNDNPVDGHAVPIPHYGVVLEWGDWETLAEKMKGINTKFIIEPYIRFKGLPGEQATMFFLDPSGNALEFKAFKDIGQLFAK